MSNLKLAQLQKQINSLFNSDTTDRGKQANSETDVEKPTRPPLERHGLSTRAGLSDVKRQNDKVERRGKSPTQEASPLKTRPDYAAGQRPDVPISFKLFQSKKHRDTKKSMIPARLPTPPFRWILVGSSESGKSTILKEVIFNDDWKYNSYFDEIYCYIGTMDDNLDFQRLAENKPHISVSKKFDADDVAELYDSIESNYKDQEENPKILIVLDDQISNGVCHPTKFNIIDKIFTEGRHYSISIIICTQKYHKLNQNTRCQNVSQVTVLAKTSRIDLEHIAKQHAGNLDPQHMLTMMTNYLTQDKYNSFHIDYKADSHARYKDRYFNTLNPADWRQTDLPARAYKELIDEIESE